MRTYTKDSLWVLPPQQDELLMVVNSVSDGNAYVAGCRHPVDKMINYLKKYFDPNDGK